MSEEEYRALTNHRRRGSRVHSCYICSYRTVVKEHYTGNGLVIHARRSMKHWVKLQQLQKLPNIGAILLSNEKHIERAKKWDRGELTIGGNEQ